MMSASEEFAEWFARNAHRFEYPDPTVNEAKHIALWQCPNGWIVGYTPGRVEKGPATGKFVTVAYKPIGRGARSGDAAKHAMAYERAFTTRKAAKAHAETLYTKHNTPPAQQATRGARSGGQR